MPAKKKLAKVVDRKAVALPLLSELQNLIRQGREQVAHAVNSALVLRYWEVGHRIRTEVLKNTRADYGQVILPTLSAKLALEFGPGFYEKNLRRMVQLAEI